MAQDHAHGPSHPSGDRLGGGDSSGPAVDSAWDWMSSWMGAWSETLGAPMGSRGAATLPQRPDRPGSLGLSDDFAASMAQRRADELLRHSQRLSPFYRRHLAGCSRPGTPWTALPTVDKRLMMAHFDDWHTDPSITLERVRAFAADPQQQGCELDGRYAVWSSSGTSGEPALYLHDIAALDVYARLLESRMDRRCAVDRWCLQASLGALGPFGLRPRSALISAVDGPYASISFWRWQCRQHPWLRNSARAMSVTWPAERLREELTAWQPAFIASYPSLLIELARWQRAGLLALAPLALWSGGERLALNTRQWIEASFGAPVVNDYGASECLSIAFECRHGRLHLNDDWVILEPIDRKGAPVPPGEASHSVLLTNLANRIQPLIRYNLGDSVTFFTDRCPCGNRRPAFTVEGRHDDTLRVDDGQGGVVHLAPMALTTAVEDGADVHRFQLRQTDPRRIELRLDLTQAADPAQVRQAAVAALRQYLAGQGVQGVAVDVSPDAPLPEPRSGKLRQVVCLLPAEAL